MGMVALLNSSSGIRVISRMGPTMPGMKQILWLPEVHTDKNKRSVITSNHIWPVSTCSITVQTVPPGRLHMSESTILTEHLKSRIVSPTAIMTLNSSSYLQNKQSVVLGILYIESYVILMYVHVEWCYLCKPSFLCCIINKLKKKGKSTYTTYTQKQQEQKHQ